MGFTPEEIKQMFDEAERRNKMKNTVIYTMEVTYITEDGQEVYPEAFKEMLNADDVVVTKEQVFMGSDEE